MKAPGCPVNGPTSSSATLPRSGGHLAALGHPERRGGGAVLRGVMGDPEEHATSAREPHLFPGPPFPLGGRGGSPGKSWTSSGKSWEELGRAGSYGFGCVKEKDRT